MDSCLWEDTALEGQEGEGMASHDCSVIAHRPGRRPGAEKKPLGGAWSPEGMGWLCEEM
jgi:hypothetical protein